MLGSSHCACLDVVAFGGFLMCGRVVGIVGRLRGSRVLLSCALPHECVLRALRRTSRLRGFVRIPRSWVCEHRGVLRPAVVIFGAECSYKLKCNVSYT